MLSLTLFRFYLLTLFATLGYAATADEWRGRSIYQLLTDRFALPKGVSGDCDSAERTWCGGTWNGIREKLDYIQDAGFTAIWISPVHKNYEGERTEYGDPYHGYWVTDLTQLNGKFGTEADLKALIKELHSRNMLLMVDIVVNNVMATTTEPDYANSDYFFKDASYYHPYCPIEWADPHSEENCWMGDDIVALPDVDTSNPEVIEKYGEWIEAFIKEYEVDGLRIDAAKHVQSDFWPVFCGKAGVFCMGEVFGGADVAPIAQWQGPLDSVLNFPMYAALRDAYTIPGPGNITGLVQVFENAKAGFQDMSLLGNFLENHDVPRWHNLSVDPQSLYNAMTWNFMTEGIPIVYAGQEQAFSGLGDPFNREALWPSEYANTTAYQYISTLNKLRNFLVKNSDWLSQETQILATTENSVGFSKGGVISILTNIGSPPALGTHIAVKTAYPGQTAMTNIVTCKQWVVGAGGSIDVEYSLGGVPVILLPSNQLKGSGLCGTELAEIAKAGGNVNAALSSSQPARWLAALILASSLYFLQIGL